MAAIPKNVSPELLGAMLKTSLDKIEHLTRITTDLRTDFKGMREQVNVCVASSMRVEQSHIELRNEVHDALDELREHRRRLETLEQPSD
jgi:glutamine synthetase type III